MSGLRRTAEDWLAAGRPAILVEVTEARGSAPREAGTRMLVAADALAGTIGGGHLELKAIALAREMLLSDQADAENAVRGVPGGTLGDAHGATQTVLRNARQSPPQSVHYPLGPALGQCCGGAVTLGYGRLDAAALAAWPVLPPMFHLQLYGAGHVGRAIVQALAPLPVRIDWIDEREDEFARHTAPISGAADIRPVCVDAVEAEVALAPPGACYLVLTHEHELDLRITEAILKRGDFAYLGLIGSKTKRQRFVHRFEQRGMAAELIERITCPIGVPGISGKEPEVIAVAVAAQLLRHRRA